MYLESQNDFKFRTEEEQYMTHQIPLKRIYLENEIDQMC